jgi:BlaI family penicillinase repressor
VKEKTKHDVPRLSEMEWEILKPLWDKGPMAARDIYQWAPKGRDWAYKTVKTMLARLVKKGALSYEQIGNSYLYKPVYSRAEMTGTATRSFIHRVFDGGIRPFLAHFVEQVSDAELELLRKELKRLEKEEDAKRRP